MLPRESQQLAHDHAELNGLLKEVQQALNGADLEVSQARLDLFWARLAVHIRAEHLHLFPSVLDGLSDTAVEPTLNEARAAVERLRSDHNFFMRELARAIETMRTLSSVRDNGTVNEGLQIVRDTIRKLEQRLVTHNQSEESQIYRWAGTVLNERSRAELAAQISDELMNRPPRFSLDVWSN